jgi:hypothetical protein
MTAYSLPGVELETPQSLRDVFELGKERPLRTTLDHLLKEVLPPWHHHGQKAEGHDLMALYRPWAGLGEGALSRNDLEERVEAVLQASRTLSAVQIERHEGSIVFSFPSDRPLTCPDPLALVYAPLEQAAPVVCRISPGRLTADNILVDNSQQAWLTNLAHSGQAPQWWDFCCLEAILRFDLSQAPDLLAWLEFEECLLQPDQLQADLDRDVVADLKMSVALIEQVRRQAGRVTGTDALPYHAGLLMWAVGALGQYNPKGLYTQAERQRGAHLLLAAALIAERISKLAHMRTGVSERYPAAEQPRASHGLRLDEDGVRVWTKPGQAVALTGQELEFFLCLYEQAGRVVWRKTLVEQVYQEPFAPTDEFQESNLNSLVRRLREKLEPDPNKPRYILTVRGKGYRLETEGTASG